MKQSKTRFGLIGMVLLSLLLLCSLFLSIPNGYVGDAARTKESAFSDDFNSVGAESPDQLDGVFCNGRGRQGLRRRDPDGKRSVFACLQLDGAEQLRRVRRPRGRRLPRIISLK